LVTHGVQNARTPYVVIRDHMVDCQGLGFRVIWSIVEWKAGIPGGFCTLSPATSAGALPPPPPSGSPPRDPPLRGPFSVNCNQVQRSNPNTYSPPFWIPSIIRSASTLSVAYKDKRTSMMHQFHQFFFSPSGSPHQHQAIHGDRNIFQLVIATSQYTIQLAQPWSIYRFRLFVFQLIFILSKSLLNSI